jgi:hypothetical protein
VTATRSRSFHGGGKKIRFRKTCGGDARLEIRQGVAISVVSEKVGVVFTNGSAVFHISRDGKKTRIAAEGMIQSVVFVSV